MARHATITIPSDHPLRCCLHKFPSAGPYCNITGMKTNTGEKMLIVLNAAYMCIV